MISRRLNLVLRYAVALAAIAVAHGLFLNAFAQTPSLESKPGQRQKPHAPATSKRVYEDQEVRIVVPPSWKVLKAGRPDDPLAPHPPAVPQTFIPPPGRGILLASRGYTLTLAYKTGHASPIKGGRFIEVFGIPWIEDGSQAWNCGVHLRESPEPVSRELLLVNLILNTSYSQEACAIPKEMQVGERWFGGYFSTAGGLYFFDSSGAECAMKAYTLTSDARTPAELPDPDDPTLRKIIGEAIDIVASIHYKRCPPARRSAP